MQYLIYPMKTISFSQLEYGEFSHKNIPAVDMTGAGTGISNCFAPCDLKVIGLGNNSSNTVYFGSVEPVICADNVVRHVTIAMSHMDDISGYKIGDTFKSGEVCYQEGKAGLATGNHVHVEVANGLHTSKEYVLIDGKRYFRFSEKDALMPTEVFYALEGWNETRKLMGVDPKWIDGREEIDYDMKLRLYNPKGTQGIRASLSFKRKKTNAKLLAVIPKGNKDARITGFVPGLQPDGYQWVKVEYHGIKGFAQWDSKYLEALEY